MSVTAKFEKMIADHLRNAVRDDLNLEELIAKNPVLTQDMKQQLRLLKQFMDIVHKPNILKLFGFLYYSEGLTNGIDVSKKIFLDLMSSDITELCGLLDEISKKKKEREENN